MNWTTFHKHPIMLQMSDRSKGDNPERVFLKRTETEIFGLKGDAQVYLQPPLDKSNYVYQVSILSRDPKINLCDVQARRTIEVYGKPQKIRDLSYSSKVALSKDSDTKLNFSYPSKLFAWRIGNSRLLLRCSGYKIGDDTAFQDVFFSFESSQNAQEITDVIWISCNVTFESHKPGGTQEAGKKILIFGLDDFDKELLKENKSYEGDTVRYDSDGIRTTREDKNLRVTHMINRLTVGIQIRLDSLKMEGYYHTGTGSCEKVDITKKKF
jgi:hypothetical protein